MRLPCPSCRSEVFKLRQGIPLICPNCGASARPSHWGSAVHLLLLLVLGAGLYFSVSARMLWPVLAGLVFYYAGLYPLRYLPLIKTQPREVAIQRAIHNSILIFLVAL